MHPVISAGTPELLKADLFLTDKYNKVCSFTMMYRPETETALTYAHVLAWADVWFNAVGGEVDDIIDHESEVTVARATWFKYPDIEIQAFSTSTAISGAEGDVLEDGANEIESLPPSDALILRKVTGYAGRQNQGRIFVPFISEQVQHDGFLDTLNVGPAQDITGALMAPGPINDIALVPVHYNRKENILVQIVSMHVMKNLGTRRDRRRKSLNIPL